MERVPFYTKDGWFPSPFMPVFLTDNLAEMQRSRDQATVYNETFYSVFSPNTQRAAVALPKLSHKVTNNSGLSKGTLQLEDASGNVIKVKLPGYLERMCRRMVLNDKTDWVRLANSDWESAVVLQNNYHKKGDSHKLLAFEDKNMTMDELRKEVIKQYGKVSPESAKTDILINSVVHTMRLLRTKDMKNMRFSDFAHLFKNIVLS